MFVMFLIQTVQVTTVKRNLVFFMICNIYQVTMPLLMFVGPRMKVQLEGDNLIDKYFKAIGERKEN